MSEIPAYIEPAIVAKACKVKSNGRKMTTRDARRMLDRAGILEHLGGNRVVADSRLRERLPDVYERVFSYFALRTTEDQGEP